MANRDDVRRIALSLPETTEPHYDGYPAILVRLPRIDLDLLNRVMTDAWRLCAPKRFLAGLSREVQPGPSTVDPGQSPGPPGPNPR